MNSESRVLFVLCALAVALPMMARADEPAATPVTAAAPADTTDYKKLYEDQKKKTDELERRVSILEEKDKAAPYVKTEDLPENTAKFLKEVDISGFVSASYEWNFNRPADGMNPGRLYDFSHDQFMANKFVAIVQKNVDYNAFDWQAGFFTEFIFGQDAASTQAAGLSLGEHGDLEQAYVQVNAPIGQGVKIIFGKYVTPLGYELVENEQNANWTQGLQWTFVEPFTHTGLQLSTKLNDEWEVNFYVNNGWDNVQDNNTSKSFLGRIGWTPNDNTSVTVIGYGGPEEDADNHDWRRGVDLVVTHKCTPKLNTAVQVDYGAEDGVDINGGVAEWYAAGVWMIYDFTEKVQGALRVDYLNDKDGVRTSDFVDMPFNTHQELTSVTFTLNLKPLENVRIAPEIRWDHSSIGTVFDGEENQVTGSIGAVVSF